MSRVKVTINKKGYIPSLGLGPIRRPVLINEELCNQLIALGYPVNILSSPVKPVIKKDETPVVAPIAKPIEAPVMEVAETTVEVQDEPAVEETVTEETVDAEVVEEEVTTEEVKEILENDPDLSAGAFYTEDFLTSKAICKKILSNREVQYERDASWGLLKQLVSDSNPEVISK